MQPKVVRMRVSTRDTSTPTTGIMHMITAPPGDNAMPASCAVYPNSSCSNCGISTVLIPQLLQELLGYTAQLAGMALSPGGAVIMCMMPVVGVLVSRVDTRILTTFGCIVSASALFVMAGWNLGLDYRHAVTARMLQSFGLAFLFIPINVAAFAYVPREKMNMGTGIINLARNVGASVGIATVTTMLQRRTQFHQARLVDHVNNLNPAVRTMTNGTTLRLISQGSNATEAAAQSHGMIYNM